MKLNMRQWADALISSGPKKPMPVLSFPSVQLLNVSVGELVHSASLQAEGMRRIALRVDAAAALSMMDLSVEAEAFGARIRFGDNEVPSVIGCLVEDMAGAESLQVPEVGAGRTGLYLDAVTEAARTITDRPVLAGVIGPFSLAGRLMDMTKIMVSCYDEPEMVHTTLRKVTDFLIAYTRAYKASGANGVVLAEPAAGLLSPALCEEFSSPYVKEIVDAVQDDQFLLVYHNCGPAVPRMIPEILSTGAGAYHFGNAVDMEDVLCRMPEDVLTMGNIDPVADFRNGTPDSVRAHTLALMETCCKHKNFLISSGCDIPPVSPWENIDAFFAAADTFYHR